MRVLPNMTVIAPCDAVETEKATLAAAKYPGPVFLRFGREPVPVITDEDSPFEIGKANVLRQGKDVSLIAIGALVYKSMQAAEEHQAAGGMGSAVAEHLARTIPTPIEQVAVQGSFGESGQPGELMAKYGLDAAAIVAAAKRVLARKK